MIGKLRDLVDAGRRSASILLLSVAVSGLVAGFSERRARPGSGSAASWAGCVAARRSCSGFAANTAAVLRALPAAGRPRRPAPVAVVRGAAGCGRLRDAQAAVRASCSRPPRAARPFQAFGIALILLVWINYFSRVVLYAAAWAYTTPQARALRDAEDRQVSPDVLALRARVDASRSMPPGVPVPADGTPPPRPAATGRRLDPRLAFGAGAAFALALVALVRRRED